MRRRRHQTDLGAGSFESFVDVVCNLIGGLLLIAVISSLAVREKVFEVFTPVEDFRMEDARSIKFAVTDRGIYPLDQDEAFSKLAEVLEKDSSSNTFAVRTRFSQWILRKDPDRLMWRLGDEPPPITDMNITSIASDATIQASKLDTDRKHFVYFFVGPHDAAFRLFRLARKVLWQNGIRVGWGPVDPQKGIVLGGQIKLRPQD